MAPLSVRPGALAAGAFAVSVVGSAASAGVVEVRFNEGLADYQFMSWNVPALGPGDTWERDFSYTARDGDSIATGTIIAFNDDPELGFVLTDFEMSSVTSWLSTFDLRGVNIDYLADSGPASAVHEFDATTDITQGGLARIDWAKTASWEGEGLPPLAGLFDFDDPLNSTLYGESGVLYDALSPVTLNTRTWISLQAGPGGNAIWLPDSAEDISRIPAPGVVAVGLGGAAVLLRRRR